MASSNRAASKSKFLSVFTSLLSRENMFGGVLGVCIVSVIYMVTARSSDVEGRPDPERLAVFDPPSFDLGTVMQKEVIRHDFRLINRSTNEMRIVALRTSCNCTVIDEALTGAGVPPQSSVLLPVKYDSGLEEGSVAQTVEVVLETQGKRHYARADLKGQISADFRVVPRSLDFGRVKPGEKATETLKIMRGALNDLVLAQPRSSGNFKFAFLTNQAALPAELCEIAVTFDAPLISSSQVFSDVLEFETSSKRVPHMKIPVCAIVAPDLEISPEIIILQRGEPAGESRVTIRSLEPSRVIRLLIMTDEGSKELPTAVVTADPNDDSSTAHVCRVKNSSLALAKRLAFEVEIRNGAGQKETRSASVQIKGL